MTNKNKRARSKASSKKDEKPVASAVAASNGATGTSAMAVSGTTLQATSSKPMTPGVMTMAQMMILVIVTISIMHFMEMREIGIDKEKCLAFFPNEYAAQSLCGSATLMQLLQRKACSWTHAMATTLMVALQAWKNDDILRRFNTGLVLIAPVVPAIGLLCWICHVGGVTHSGQRIAIIGYDFWQKSVLLAAVLGAVCVPWHAQLWPFLGKDVPPPVKHANLAREVISLLPIRILQIMIMADLYDVWNWSNVMMTLYSEENREENVRVAAWTFAVGLSVLDRLTTVYCYFFACYYFKEVHQRTILLLFGLYQSVANVAFNFEPLSLSANAQLGYMPDTPDIALTNASLFTWFLSYATTLIVWSTRSTHPVASPITAVDAAGTTKS